MDDNIINKVIEPYVYSKVNALEEVLNEIEVIEYNPVEKTIIIPDLYFRESQKYEGECGELVFLAIDELKKLDPKGHYYFAYGTEPDHFPYGHHCFIVKSDGQLLYRQNDSIEFEYGIEHALGSKKRLKIIDPCFKKIIDYDNSDYCIQGIRHIDNTCFLKPGDLVLGDIIKNPQLENKKHLVSQRPLGFNDDGELTYLKGSYHYWGMDNEPDDPKDILCISIQKPKEEPIFLNLTYTDLSFIKNKTIETLMYILREIPLVPTDRTLI